MIVVKNQWKITWKLFEQWLWLYSKINIRYNTNTMQAHIFTDGKHCKLLYVFNMGLSWSDCLRNLKTLWINPFACLYIRDVQWMTADV